MIPIVVFALLVGLICFAVVWAIGQAGTPRTVRCYKPDGEGGYRHVFDLTPRQRLGWWLVRTENLILRRVGQGEVMPRLYGLAWVRYDAPYAVFMPIPLNLIARGCRVAWMWAKRGGAAVPADPAEAYAAGRRAERARWESWLEDPLG